MECVDFMQPRRPSRISTFSSIFCRSFRFGAGESGGISYERLAPENIVKGDGKRLISSAILYLLGMPSKKGGNISPRRFLRLFISFKFIIFHVDNPLASLRRYRFDCGSP